VSVSHQFIGWSDNSGMYVAEPPSGPWTRTGFGHAGEPLLDAMTASMAKATFVAHGHVHPQPRHRAHLSGATQPQPNLIPAAAHAAEGRTLPGPLRR